MRSAVLAIALVAALATPGIVLRATGTHIGTVPDTVLFGLTIVAAAFPARLGGRGRPRSTSRKRWRSPSSR